MAAFADLINKDLLADYDGALAQKLREEFAAKSEIPTKASLGLSRVEDKSSGDIRGELSSGDVTQALGYTPPRTDTTYRTWADLPD